MSSEPFADHNYKEDKIRTILNEKYDQHCMDFIQLGTFFKRYKTLFPSKNTVTTNEKAEIIDKSIEESAHNEASSHVATEREVSAVVLVSGRDMETTEKSHLTEQQSENSMSEGSHYTHTQDSCNNLSQYETLRLVETVKPASTEKILIEDEMTLKGDKKQDIIKIAAKYLEQPKISTSPKASLNGVANFEREEQEKLSARSYWSHNIPITRVSSNSMNSEYGMRTMGGYEYSGYTARLSKKKISGNLGIIIDAAKKDSGSMSLKFIKEVDDIEKDLRENVFDSQDKEIENTLGAETDEIKSVAIIKKKPSSNVLPKELFSARDHLIKEAEEETLQEERKALIMQEIKEEKAEEEGLMLSFPLNKDLDSELSPDIGSLSPNISPSLNPEKENENNELPNLTQFKEQEKKIVKMQSIMRGKIQRKKYNQMRQETMEPHYVSPASPRANPFANVEVDDFQEKTKESPYKIEEDLNVMYYSLKTEDEAGLALLHTKEKSKEMMKKKIKQTKHKVIPEISPQKNPKSRHVSQIDMAHLTPRTRNSSKGKKKIKMLPNHDKLQTERAFLKQVLESRNDKNGVKLRMASTDTNFTKPSHIPPLKKDTLSIGNYTKSMGGSTQLSKVSSAAKLPQALQGLEKAPAVRKPTAGSHGSRASGRPESGNTSHIDSIPSKTTNGRPSFIQTRTGTRGFLPSENSGKKLTQHLLDETKQVKSPYSSNWNFKVLENFFNVQCLPMGIKEGLNMPVFKIRKMVKKNTGSAHDAFLSDNLEDIPNTFRRNSKPNETSVERHYGNTRNTNIGDYQMKSIEETKSMEGRAAKTSYMKKRTGHHSLAKRKTMNSNPLSTLPHSGSEPVIDPVNDLMSSKKASTLKYNSVKPGPRHPEFQNIMAQNKPMPIIKAKNSGRTVNNNYINNNIHININHNFNALTNPELMGVSAQQIPLSEMTKAGEDLLKTVVSPKIQNYNYIYNYNINKPETP